MKIRLFKNSNVRYAGDIVCMNGLVPERRATKLGIFFLISLLIISLLPVSGAFAYRMVYKSHVETEPTKIEFIGGEKGEQFGAAIASGDINGDGVDDLVVGSPFHSSGGNTWNGMVSVYFGDNGVHNRLFDAGIDFPDVAIYGRYSGDQIGNALAVGDFNDDNYDDILIGAYNAMSDDKRLGKAFLIYGRSDYKIPAIKLGEQTADKEFLGKNDGDYFGFSVEMADINNDNIDDILIGAPFAMSMEAQKTGAVYGYNGSTRHVDSVDGHGKYFGGRDADVVFYGSERGERFGSAIAVGDVLDSSYDDIVVSAYYASGLVKSEQVDTLEVGRETEPDSTETGVEQTAPLGVEKTTTKAGSYKNIPQAGKVYIFKGLKKFQKSVTSPSVILTGEEPYGWFGFDLSIDRFGDDKKDDLAVSSFPYLNNEKIGKVYIISGRTKFLGGREFSVNKDSADYYFEGIKSENAFGASLEFMDIDHDRKKDLVVGAPGVNLTKNKSTEEGEIYVFYNRMIDENEKSFYLKKDQMNSVIYGENADDWFGSEVASIDYNGDGFKDIVVSSRYADRYDDFGKIAEANVGKVYILLGSKTPFGDELLVREESDEYVTRGEFVKTIIEDFKLAENRKDFIDSCYTYREFCFFAFTAQTTYSKLSLEPNIVLYPDVPYGSEYYEPITVATMLGLVNGFSNEANTPFKPASYITRIQALKVVLASNQLVEPLFRFELIEKLGGLAGVEAQKSYFVDVDPRVSSMWWYPLFTNYAYEKGLVDDGKYFRPDEYITKGELDEIVGKTLGLVGKSEGV